uniref:Uncharacterized protein n=1 Tax=Rhizophora mucronata TaxID=61149 RepID=A0A2P2NMH8_RHIMU
MFMVKSLWKASDFDVLVRLIILPYNCLSVFQK